MWCGAWTFVNIYSKLQVIDSQTKVAMLITCGIANTGFFGFPIISAYYSEAGIQDAIIFDQMTFLLFSTLGIITILKAHAGVDGRVVPSDVVKKIVTFPPFLACIVALILSLFTDISALNPLFDRLVGTLSPLALFSIGLQMRFDGIKKELPNLAACLSYKLVFAPFLVLLLALALGSKGDFARINVMEAAMPAHITASLMASQFNQNPRLCSLAVCVGLLLGLVTTFLWWFGLEKIF
jgi:hypothetical protein